MLYSPDEQAVINLRHQHHPAWHDMPEDYWLERLTKEVSMLESSLGNRADFDVEFELKQIAAICINWLEMRRDKIHGKLPKGE